MIKINNLTFGYKEDQTVLDNLSIDIKKGEFVTIIGHNGSGKSTLSKLLIGLLKKRAGSIVVDGIELEHDTIDAVRKKISIVFQNPDNQFVGSTVLDDIAFGLENMRYSREEMLAKIDTYSKRVGMDKFLDKEPHNLSGGQKQRVAIAGALAMGTEIIIFDEATSMLDPKGRAEIITLIQELNKEGKTVLMITHDLEEAKLSDRIIVLSKGNKILEGTPKEVFKEYKLLKEVSLDIPMALNVLVNTDAKKKEIIDLLWELSLEK